jgi:hypothetical protein
METLYVLEGDRNNTYPKSNKSFTGLNPVLTTNLDAIDSDRTFTP